VADQAGAAGGEGGQTAPAFVGMPAVAMITAIFEGVALAVGQVSGIIEGVHYDLAHDPCLWKNTMSLKYGDLTRERQKAYGLGRAITQAGAAAVLSAWTTAGFDATGRKFNQTTIQHFGKWLLDRGYPTGIAISPVFPHLPDPYFFVRHGPPDASSSAGAAVPGYGGAVRLIGAGGALTLGGPEIWAQFLEWRTYAQANVEPKGTVRTYQGARGWRQILFLLTGVGPAPAWNGTDPVDESSLLGAVTEIRALVAALLVEATEACAAVRDADLDDDTTSTGGGTKALVALVLAKAAGWL